jgi:hypothetical protein
MTPFGREPLFRLEVDVRPPEPLDRASGGPVRLVSITGGRVSGGLEGVILAGGADWQTLRGDGAIEIEARYMLELADGARAELQSRGLRAAGASGFWSSMWLRCEAEAYRALNQTQFLAKGRKLERHVAIDVFPLPELTG